MMIIWCVVALAGLGGLYFAIRARAIRGRKYRQVSSEASAELIRRADQQNRWALRGDTRGVYGAKGAELMRSISPELNVGTELDRATAYPRTAAVACTPESLATLLAERLPCWRWAAVASVLVQRRAGLESRLLDNQLGYAVPSGERAPGGAEVGRFVLDRMDELLTLVSQVEIFMLTPAFVGVFGEPGDDGSADADGILRAANRLMDYHERFLGLAERCRGLAAPSHYAGLLRDLAHLMDAPLAGYRTFINQFVERVGEMPESLHYARGAIELDPVLLHVDADDKLLGRISKRLNQISAD
jgi:hypothetical protein